MPANVRLVFTGDPTQAVAAVAAVEKAIEKIPQKVKSLTATVGQDMKVVLSDINLGMKHGAETSKEFSLAMINLRDAGAAFAIIGRQIKAVIDEAVLSFVDFDKTIQQTATLATDAGAKISQTLRKDLADTARDTAIEFNQDIVSTAVALRELVAMGFSAEEAMTILRAGAQGAVAGLGEIDDTTRLVANTIRSFGLELTDATEVAAIFTFIGQKTNLTMDQFAAAMQYAGAIAGQMGFSLEETAAILGVMANAGLDASVAGTTLRQFLVRIQDPTTEARQKLDELGIATTNAEGEFLSIAEVLSNVDIATRHLTDAERAGVIATLFETRGQAAFNLTMAQGLDELTGLTSQAKAYNNEQKAQAFLTEQANKMLNAQSVAYERARKEQEKTQQLFGEKLIPSQIAWLGVSNSVTRSIIEMPGPIGQANAGLLSMGQIALDSSGKFFFLITSIQTASKSIQKSIPEIKQYISTMAQGGHQTAEMTSKVKLLRGAMIGLGLAYLGVILFTQAMNAKTNEERILFSILTGLTWGLATASVALAVSKQLALPVAGIVAAGAAIATYVVAIKSAEAAAAAAQGAQRGALVMARPGRGRIFRVGEGIESEVISPESTMRRIVSEEVMNIMKGQNQVSNQDTFIFNIPPTQRISEREARRWAEVTMETKRRKLRRI